MTLPSAADTKGGRRVNDDRPPPAAAVVGARVEFARTMRAFSCTCDLLSAVPAECARAGRAASASANGLGTPIRVGVLRDREGEQHRVRVGAEVDEQPGGDPGEGGEQQRRPEPLLRNGRPRRRWAVPLAAVAFQLSFGRRARGHGCVL